MTKKKRTPVENERREKIRELMKISNVGSMEDIQKLFKFTPYKLFTQNSGLTQKTKVSLHKS